MSNPPLSTTLSSSQNKSDNFYEAEYLRWLTVAHKATIILYTKDKHSVHIGRQIRPEVNKIYVANELNDVTALLDKYASVTDQCSIDIIIADCDHLTPKIVELIKKRTSNEETAMLPLIPIILLMPDFIEEDIKNNIKNVGGVEAILPMNSPASLVFKTLLEVLHRRTMVEGVYLELRKRLKNAKYPYVPLFEDDADGGDEEEDLKMKSHDDIQLKEDNEDEEEKFTEEELDNNNWAEETDVLPPFVRELRENFGKQLNKKRLLVSTKTKGLDPKNRAYIDIQLLNALKSDGSVGEDLNEESSMISSTKSAEPKTPSESYRARKTFFKDDNINLLDTIYRPKLNTKSGIVDTENLGSDFLPFINKEKPDMNKYYTVGGLNKKGAKACWKVLHTQNKFGPGHAERKRSKPWEVKSTTSSKNQTQQKAEAKLDSPSQSSNSQNKQGDPSCSPVQSSKDTKWGVVKRQLSTGSEQSKSEQEIPLTPKRNVLNVIGNWRGVAETATFDDAGNRVKRYSSLHTILREAGGIAFGSIVFGKRARTKARKLIRELLAKTTPDPDLTKILMLTLENRRIGSGEREHIEVGLTHQKMGHLSLAVKSFTRAMDVCKNIHVPIICRANVYFQEGHMFNALHDYNSAIKHLTNEKDQSSTEHINDCKIAYFNRGVAKFRLGDDDMGIDDIKEALKFDPENVVIRRMLILAYRRTNQYLDAIEHCLILSEQDNERSLSELNEKYRAELEASQTDSSILKEGLKMTIHSRLPGPTPNRGAGLPGLSPNSSAILPNVERMNLLSNRTTHLQHLTRLNSVEDNRKSTVIKVEVREYKFPGLKEKKEEYTQKRKKEETSQSSMFLENFKHASGFKRDVYSTLFVRLSALQEALVTSPSDRSKDQINEISATIKTFPFLIEQLDSVLQDLASCIEYRTIVTNSTIFHQGDPVNSFVLLLTGQIQLKLESAQETIILSTLKPQDCYGHIDMLFLNTNSDFVQHLKRKCASGERIRNSDDPNIEDNTEDAFDMQNIFAPRHLDEEKVNRSLAPGSFMECKVTKASELLVLHPSDFDRLYREQAEKDFYDRLEVLQASGVFSGGQFTSFDLVRLMRMSLIKTYAQDSVVMKQGEKPEFLCFVMKGICTVTKRPDPSENLIRRLESLKAAAATHDMKYSFHHKLRRSATPASDEYKKSNPAETYCTAAEEARKHMTNEINKLEVLVAKAKAAEMKKLEEEAEMKILGRKIKSSDVEIASIKWPQLFGEACMLQRDTGCSLGTIKAETVVTILCIHCSHLETFKIDDQLLERVRLRAVVYPADETLLEMIKRNKEWDEYKQVVISDIPKDKWINMPLNK